MTFANLPKFLNLHGQMYEKFLILKTLFIEQYGSLSDGVRVLKCRKPYSSLGLRVFIENSLNCIP